MLYIIKLLFSRKTILIAQNRLNDWIVRIFSPNDWVLFYWTCVVNCIISLTILPFTWRYLMEPSQKSIMMINCAAIQVCVVMLSLSMIIQRYHQSSSRKNIIAHVNVCVFKPWLDYPQIITPRLTIFWNIIKKLSNSITLSRLENTFHFIVYST